MKKGFTLIELIVVLSLIALLSTYSVYSLNEFKDRQALVNLNSELLSSLYFSQHYSQASGYTTIICTSRNMKTCEQSFDWSHGWIVYRDSNQNHNLDSDETIILVKQPQTKALTIKLSAPHTGKKIIFYPNGRLWPNGSFTICNNQLSIGHKLVFILSGRIRSEKFKNEPC